MVSTVYCIFLHLTTLSPDHTYSATVKLRSHFGRRMLNGELLGSFEP